MGCCCFPPERVELTVNSKKETNSRVRMGQGPRWAFVICPLKESKWAKDSLVEIGCENNRVELGQKELSFGLVQVGPGPV